jgi:hypothetical protein
MSANGLDQAQRAPVNGSVPIARKSPAVASIRRLGKHAYLTGLKEHEAAFLLAEHGDRELAAAAASRRSEGGLDALAFILG